MDLLLWVDSCSEVTGSYVVFDDEEEIFDIWLEELGSPEIDVVLLNREYCDVLPAVAEFASHVGGYNNRVPSNAEYDKFIRGFQGLIKSESGAHIPSFPIPRIVFRAEALVERIKTCNELRSSLLRQLAWSSMRGVDFTHSWWLRRPGFLDDLDRVERDLRRLKGSSRPYDKMWRWLEDLRAELNRMVSGKLEYQLSVASALAFVAAKFSIEESQADKALLLLHRSVDLYFQSLAAGFRVVAGSNDGLVYVRDEGKDVTLDRTKRELLYSKRINISVDLRKKVDRLNFLRNRSVLTHSMCSITQFDVEEQKDELYRVITSLDGSDGDWRRLVRKLAASPALELIDVFLNEESFDSYFSIVRKGGRRSSD